MLEERAASEKGWEEREQMRRSASHLSQSQVGEKEIEGDCRIEVLANILD